MEVVSPNGRRQRGRRNMDVVFPPARPRRVISSGGHPVYGGQAPRPPPEGALPLWTPLSSCLGEEALQGQHEDKARNGAVRRGPVVAAAMALGDDLIDQYVEHRAPGKGEAQRQQRSEDDD